MEELFNYDSIVALVSGALGIVSLAGFILNFILQFLRNKKINNELKSVLGKSREFVKSGDANLLFSQQTFQELTKIINELKSQLEKQDTRSKDEAQELQKQIDELNNKLKTQKDNLRNIGKKLK